MRIGCIGLGVMGGHMAANLSRSNDVCGFDLDPDRCERLRKAGGEIGSTAQEAARERECVFLSLPSSQVVREVTIGTSGIMDALEPGSCVIDTSTTDPEVSREIARILSEEGIHFLDAPVSGGEGGARDASLAIMVGGPQEVFDRYKPLLAQIGRTITRVGDTGAGGVAKLANNMIVGIAFAAVAEAFAFANDAGVDSKVLYDAIRGGWAGSTVLDVAAPGIINNDFEPGGSVDIHYKDLGYALNLAQSNETPTPVTSLTFEIFKTAKRTGRGGKAQHVLRQLWQDLDHPR